MRGKIRNSSHYSYSNDVDFFHFNKFFFHLSLSLFARCVAFILIRCRLSCHFVCFLQILIFLFQFLFFRVLHRLGKTQPISDGFVKINKNRR